MPSFNKGKPMHLLLFIIYGVLLCYLLRRMRFFRDSGIRPRVLTLLFGLRVAAGSLHNYVAYRFYPNHGDIWAFFDVSFITRQELFHDWHRFVADNAIWAYLPYNTVIFLHILFNFLSFDNMYINTLFFCFLIFAGSIALFRAFRGLLGNDPLSAACVLLIPSTLFWTGCIHKEGLIYLSLGFFFYYLQAALGQGWNRGRVTCCLLFLGMTAFFRPVIALTLLPGLIAWAIFDRNRNPFRITRPDPSPRPLSDKRPLSGKLRRICLGISLAVLILAGFAHPAFFSGILSTISRQQLDFQALHGNSRIYLPVLEPNAGSFLRVLPTALFNGFFQPLPGSGGQPIYMVFSVELLLIWFLVLWALITLIRRLVLPRSRVVRSSPGLAPPSSTFAPPSPSITSPSPGLFPPTGGSAASASTGFLCCCLLFSFFGLLLIGYIIPFAGAIIRYRSLYLPFLIVPFIHLLTRQPFFARLNERLDRTLINKWE